MKKQLIILAMLFIANVYSQTPNIMSFQAVIRDGNSQILNNTTIGAQISILQNSTSGFSVYTEQHTSVTNDNGLLTIEIGSGMNINGIFSTIDWSQGPYFIQTEIDKNGGSNYQLITTSQLMAVPYSFYAHTAENFEEQDTAFWKNNSQGIHYNSGNVGIGTITPTFNLQVFDVVTDSKRTNALISTTGGNTAGTTYIGTESIIFGQGGFNRAMEVFSGGISTGQNQGIFASAIGAVINRGVVGTSIMNNSNTNGFNYGISGEASSSTFSNIAVGAYANGGSTTNGDNYGISTEATSSTINGANYGIYSRAQNGSINYAGFFNGNVTVTGNFVNASDMRLKKDVEEINKATNILMKINPVTYYYKSDEFKDQISLPNNLQYGFLAQEIEKVLPTLVSEQTISNTTSNLEDVDKEDMEFKGVNYIGLIPLLVKGLQEQQLEIEELKKLIQELKLK